jgi:hypothetical protein
MVRKWSTGPISLSYTTPRSLSDGPEVEHGAHFLFLYYPALTVFPLRNVTAGRVLFRAT